MTSDVNTIMKSEKLLYSRREACELLGISLWLLDRLVSEEKLTPLRIGDRPLFSRAQLEEFAGVKTR